MIHLTDKEVHRILQQLRELETGAAVLRIRVEHLVNQFRGLEETKYQDDLAPMRSTNQQE